MDNKAIEQLISVRIIQEDAEAIYSLMISENDPVFAMEVLPYYALFVQSCAEFLGGGILTEQIAAEIKNIRNYIKAYSDSFGTSKKRITSVDSEQDEVSRAYLKYDFLKNWNIHLNLGTYWSEDGHIVGNTQQLSDFLKVKDVFDADVKEEMYVLAQQIASFVVSVRAAFAKSIDPPQISRKMSGIAIKKHYDINTNRQEKLFKKTTRKEINLFLLHLLSNINFVNYILKECFSEHNLWLFRVEFVSTYYTFRALYRLHNYCENNELKEIDVVSLRELLSTGEPLFKSEFRNCMMHYGLEGRGVLKEEHIEKPFYGIIETCFPDLNYEAYSHLLRGFSASLTRYIEQFFDCSGIELKDL